MWYLKFNELNFLLDIPKVNTEINNPKEKPPIKFVVRNQLKNKSKLEVVNRKGPMKAVIPIGNMHRKGIHIMKKLNI